MTRSEIRPVSETVGPGIAPAPGHETVEHCWVVDEKNKRHDLTLTKTHLVVDGSGFVLSETKCLLKREQPRRTLLVGGIVLAVVGMAVIFVRGMWGCLIGTGYSCNGFWDASVPAADYAVLYGVCAVIAGVVCVGRFALLRRIVLEIPGLPPFTVKALSPEFPGFWLTLATSIGIDSSRRIES